MTKNYYEDLMVYLNGLSQGINTLVDTGVCGTVAKFSPHALAWAKFVGDGHYHKALDSWKYYSNNPVYPIQSTSETETAERAYDKALISNAMWVGEYGNRRKHLCKHLADYIEAKIVVPEQIEALMPTIVTEKLRVAKKYFNSEVTHSVYGICFNFIDRIEQLVGKTPELDDLLILSCRELQCYSGMPPYPIKHAHRNPRYAYTDLNKWSKTSKYGKQRWAVLELMRKYINNEFDKRKQG